MKIGIHIGCHNGSYMGADGPNGMANNDLFIAHFFTANKFKYKSQQCCMNKYGDGRTIEMMSLNVRGTEVSARQ